MGNKSHPGIYAINTEIGALTRIEKIKTDKSVYVEMVKDLRKSGVNSFSKINTPLNVLLNRSILKTLSLAELDKSDIDGVMIVTESYSELVKKDIENGMPPFRVGRNMIFDILTELGLDQVRVFSSTYGGSGNFLNAMFLADSIVRAKRIKNLLMVCFDQVPENVSRFMEDALAVTGDGVSTFVYGYRKHQSFPIHKVDHVNFTSFMKAESYVNMGEKMLEMYRSTKCAAADCYDHTGRQPANYDWLILNNYNFPSNKIFCNLLGFSLQKTWMHNAARIGHIASCDSIINFSDMIKSGIVVNGTNILMFINGPISCGVISLTTVIP
jgi:3-oxoacyl-[acyl-carrier-protein] synthase III